MSKPEAARHQIVIDAVKAGRMYKEAGALIGVSRQRAQQICSRAGVKSQHNVRFSSAEIAQAAALLKRDMPQGHIACIIKRHPSSLRRMLVRHRFHTPSDNQAMRNCAAPRWSTRDTRALQRWREQGKTYAWIARKLKRPIGSCTAKAKRMGLCAPTGYVFRPRDENGWHIPAEGTQQRAIYGLMCKGMGPTAIGLRLGISAQHASGHMNAIRNPDRCNHQNAVRMAKKRQASLDALSDTA